MEEKIVEVNRKAVQLQRYQYFTVYFIIKDMKHPKKNEFYNDSLWNSEYVKNS